MPEHRFIGDYMEARELVDNQFYALLMATILRADKENLAKLREGWPELVQECHDRYEQPGFMFPGERWNGYRRTAEGRVVKVESNDS